MTSGGQMSLAAGSPFASPQGPASLALNGNYIYAAVSDNFGPDGLLTFQRNPSTGAVQFLSGIAMPPQDSLALSASGSNLYSVGTSTGLISEFQVTAGGALVSKGTVSAGTSASYAFHIVTDPLGRYIGVSSHNGSTLYSVDASGTILTVGPDVVPIENQPSYITFDSTGAYAPVLAGTQLLVYGLPGSDIRQLTTTTGTANPGVLTMFTK